MLEHASVQIVSPGTANPLVEGLTTVFSLLESGTRTAPRVIGFLLETVRDDLHAVKCLCAQMPGCAEDKQVKCGDFQRHDESARLVSRPRQCLLVIRPPVPASCTTRSYSFLHPQQRGGLLDPGRGLEKRSF